MIKHIVLITSSHLSSNPRIVKEAKALLEANFMVDILCAQNLNDLAVFDEEIFENLKGVSIKIINYTNNGILSRYLKIKSTLRLKLASLKVFKIFKTFKYISRSRMLPEMKAALKEMKADLYIAHTIAALPAAAWASKYHNSRYAFDAEDLHRNETNNPEIQTEIIKIENEFLPECAYISTASPFSTDIYKEYYPNQNIITVNNFFTNNTKTTKSDQNKAPLKIVWFSQTIGLNRGLKEFILKLVKVNPAEFELHLRGTSNGYIKSKLLDGISKSWSEKIFFHPQCSPHELDLWLQDFDIGLALEANEPLNRDICITNKIFQYFNAGLAVIATPTIGQTWVINQAPDAGIILLPTGDLNTLSGWAENRVILNHAKKAAIIAVKNKFDWHNEKKKIIDVIKEIQSDKEFQHKSFNECC